MLFLTLTCGILLLPKADTLKCYQCVPGVSGLCSDTIKECPAQCATRRVLIYHGSSSTADVHSKTCLSAAACVESSLNYGVNRTVITSKCCTTDLCNIERAPDASKSKPNGKKCFRCDGQKCTTTLNCEGDEDYCVSTTVKAGGETEIKKGCASKLICSDTQTAQTLGGTAAEISCCQGDYCNSASSTGAGLLLLVAPLMFLVF